MSEKTKTTSQPAQKKQAPQQFSNLKSCIVTAIEDYETQKIVIYQRKGEVVTEEVSDSKYYRLKNRLGHRMKEASYSVPKSLSTYRVSLEDISATSLYTENYHGHQLSKIVLRRGWLKNYRFYITGNAEEALGKLKSFGQDENVNEMNFTKEIQAIIPDVTEKIKANGWAKAEKLAEEMREEIAQKRAKRQARIARIKNIPNWIKGGLSKAANSVFKPSAKKDPAPKVAAQPKTPAAKPKA